MRPMGNSWISLIVLYLFSQVQGPAPPDLPLEKGSYWVYRGNVAWTAANSATVQRQSIEWRTEVTEVIERDSLVVAVLKGHPRDLISFEPKRQPGLHLLVQVSGRKHYMVSAPRAETVLKRIKDPSDLLADLFQEGEIFLETPLSLGQRFCETAGLARTDWMYCWIVEEERTPTVKRVPGVPSMWDGPEYGIYRRTLPSHEVLGFAPGIGVTSYDFMQNSSVSEVQLKLVEFGRSKP